MTKTRAEKKTIGSALQYCVGTDRAATLMTALALSKRRLPTTTNSSATKASLDTTLKSALAFKRKRCVKVLAIAKVSR